VKNAECPDVSAARGLQRRHLGFQLVDARPALQDGAGHFLGVEVTSRWCRRIQRIAERWVSFNDQGH
jgi:hypothetical protein